MFHLGLLANGDTTTNCIGVFEFDPFICLTSTIVIIIIMFFFGFGMKPTRVRIFAVPMCNRVQKAAALLSNEIPHFIAFGNESDQENEKKTRMQI